MESAALAASSHFPRLQNPNPNSSPSKRSLLRWVSCAQNHNPSFRLSRRNPSSAVTPAAAVTAEAAFGVADPPRSRLQRLVSEFQSLLEPVDRVKRLLEYVSLLPPLADGDRVPENRVMGCTSQVWVAAWMDGKGRMRFAAASDAEIVKGLCSCLIWVLDGAAPEEVLAMRAEDLGVLNFGFPAQAESRSNTWHNILIGMQKRTKAIVAEREGKQPFEPFPSLVIGVDGIHAKGSFAEAQV